MAFRKGASGNPKGREKGTPNKVTKDAKEMLELAAKGVGGLKALTKFGKDRPDIFWPMWSKLLPKNIEVGGRDGKDIVVRFIHEAKPQ